MAHIITEWLNNQVELSKTITSFEDNFANGYLFAELLAKYNQISNLVAYEDKHNTTAQMTNFDLLKQALRVLNIELPSNTALEIMNKKKGSAENLLYKIKMALDKVSGSNTNKKGNRMGPQPSHTSKAIYEAQEDKMFKTRIQKALVPEKVVLLDKKLQKFKDEQKRQEAAKKVKEEEEKVRFLAEKERKRNANLDKLRRNAGFMEEWEMNGQKEWQKNIAKKLDREKKEFEFENKNLVKLTTMALKSKEHDKQIIDKEINEFESVVTQKERYPKQEEIPTEKSTENVRAPPEAPSVDSSAKSVASPVKKMISEQEKKERDRRRRKMIVDLGKSQAEEEAQRREDDIIDKLKKKSKQEKELCYEEWRTQQCKNVIVENRKLRDTRYQKRTELDTQIALIREEEAHKHLNTLRMRMHGSEAHRMNEIAISLKQRIRKKLQIVCGVMMEDIINIADFAYESLQNKDIKDLDISNLNDWMHLFITSQPAEAATSLKDVEGSNCLNEKEFVDYLNLRNMWSLEVKTMNPTTNALEQVKIPPSHIQLGDIIKAIIEINFSAIAQQEQVEYPFYLPIKLCIIGKQFSGKKSVMEYLQKKYGIEVIEPISLINEELAGESSISKRIKELLSDGSEIGDEICAELIKHKILKLFPYKNEKQVWNEFEDDVRKNCTQMQSFVPQPEAKKDEAKKENQEINIINNDDKKPVVEALNIWKPSGFMIMGFPNNMQQAITLESLLINFKDPRLQSPTKKEILLNEAMLLYPPSKIEAKKEELQMSAFDGVLFLNASSEKIMQRSYGTLYDSQAKAFYHLDSNPPPLNQGDLCERLQQYKNEMLDEYVLTDKIAAFDIGINGLYKWYHQFGRKEDSLLTFNIIDCNEEIKVVQSAIDNIIEKILSTKRKERAEQEKRVKDKMEQEKEQKRKEEEEKKRKDEEELKRKEEEEKKRKEKEKEDELEDIEEGKQPESLTIPFPEVADNKKKEEVKKEEAAESKEPQAVVPKAEAPKIVLEIEQAFKQPLLNEWLGLFTSYTNSLRSTMGMLRKNRELFTKEYKTIQTQFITHILLPDNRQQKIDNFVDNYNTFLTEHPDMIEKAEVKQEMHQRTEDLMDTIFECIEQRKRDASTKREMFMQSGLMEYFLKLLIIDLVNLYQSEADKYLRVRQLIKDYYNALEKHELHELPTAPPKFTIDESLSLLENGKSPRFQDITNKAINFTEPTADIPNEKEQVKGKKEAPKKTGKAAQNVVVEPEVVSECQKSIVEKLAVEEAAYKYRIGLINSYGEKEISKITSISGQIFTKMLAWIQVQYNVEISTMKNIETIARKYIESEQKIQHELMIVDHDLHVNKQYAYYITPPPKPWPAREKTNENTFSINQLKNICNLIRINSEGGEISYHTFIAIFNAMRYQTITHESYIGLPQSWLNINTTQIKDFLHKLDVSSTGCVNYKALCNIICLQNSRIPTELEMSDLKNKATMTSKDGKLDKAAFCSISFWFDNTEACDNRPNSEEFYRFNKIKEVLFANFVNNQGFVDIDEYLNLASMKEYNLPEKTYRDIIFENKNNQ